MGIDSTADDQDPAGPPLRGPRGNGSRTGRRSTTSAIRAGSAFLSQQAPLNAANLLRGALTSAELEVAIRQHPTPLLLLPLRLALPQVGERHLAHPERMVPSVRRDP